MVHKVLSYTQNSNSNTLHLWIALVQQLLQNIVRPGTCIFLELQEIGKYQYLNYYWLYKTLLELLVAVGGSWNKISWFWHFSDLPRMYSSWEEALVHQAYNKEINVENQARDDPMRQNNWSTTRVIVVPDNMRTILRELPNSTSGFFLIDKFISHWEPLAEQYKLLVLEISKFRL